MLWVLQDSNNEYLLSNHNINFIKQKQMGLLNILTSVGNTLGFGGDTPPSPTPTIPPKTFLKGSDLDLDGQTPTTYADTAPENQGGRV